MKKLTIFTPTYNRGLLLKRLFNSLKCQTNKEFEWIIVDDESIDDTEDIVNDFINESDFPIRYYRQQHGGKHRAINLGVSYAIGDYFFIVDSDDYLVRNAVELIYGWLAQVSGNNCIGGVAGLKTSPRGDVWGGVPLCGDVEWIDADNFEREKYGLEGDKAEIYQTALIKNNLFPEFDGEFFVTEAVCWDKIAALGYKVRWYNVPLYVCEYLEDGLTKNGANALKGHLDNYKGYCYYISQCLRIKPRILSIINFREFNKTCRSQKRSLRARAKDLEMTFGNYMIWYCFIVPVYSLFRIGRRLIYSLKKMHSAV